MFAKEIIYWTEKERGDQSRPGEKETRLRHHNTSGKKKKGGEKTKTVMFGL